MPRRKRIDLIAIPPEAQHDEMTILKLTHRGVAFGGDGPIDWFCGRCGRILANGVYDDQMLNLWVTCPGCGWLNGLDFDLGWAEYLVRRLAEREISLERLRQIADVARDPRVLADEFAEATSDAGPALAWLRKISVATLIAVLNLLVTLYFDDRSLDVAEQALKAAEHPASAQSPKRQVTPADLARIARELHQLQREIKRRPPRRSTRGHGHR